jgi:hypothetical protein
MNDIEKGIQTDLETKQKREARNWFEKLIQKDQIVGDLFSINYEKAKVQIHDSLRNRVGGIPSLSFLIATRVDPEQDDDIDFKSEDASFILLRVMDSTPLPHSSEAERIRVETAQRVSGETEKHWDEAGIMDSKTKYLLGYAGVECRIIGTFYLDTDKQAENGEGKLHLKFGSDISNYYPNRGLKVYKPIGKALEMIVNYTDPFEQEEHFNEYGTRQNVSLGNVRYASTNRKYQQVDDVPVRIYPADLLSQKTALFGMTRTGKSNTTKVIAKSVYELRQPKTSEYKPLHIGQIIFDPNGEYANENVQDNNNALKNIWELKYKNESPEKKKELKAKEIATYGITSHPNDPDRKLMLLNFYVERNLQIGKEIIDSLFTRDDPIYLRNFAQVIFERPDENDRSALTRYRRRVLAYRSILYRAGFQNPQNITPNTNNLFNGRLLTALENFEGEDQDLYHSAARIFRSNNPSWGNIASAFEALEKFIRKTDEYREFEDWYVNQRQNASGERWADEDLKKLLGVFQYANGIRRIGRIVGQHTSATSVITIKLV